MLKLKPFTDAEKAFMQANSATMTPSEIGRALGRGRAAVRKYIVTKGLPKFTRYRYWSPKDVEQLMELSERYSYKEIAKRMGRTPDNVDYKLCQMGISTRTDVFSVRKAMRYTGYDRRQLERARDALNQLWVLDKYRLQKNKKPMLRYRISYVQLEQLCDYLRTEV